jgi:hypothetical protein
LNDTLYAIPPVLNTGEGCYNEKVTAFAF